MVKLEPIDQEPSKKKANHGSNNLFVYLDYLFLFIFLGFLIFILFKIISAIWMRYTIWIKFPLLIYVGRFSWLIFMDLTEILSFYSFIIVGFDDC